MTDYTILNNKIKDEMINFIKKLSKDLNKIDTHFVLDMINGIIKSSSVNLSEIARANCEKPNIKKYVERLERHLDSFSEIENTIKSNYVNLVKPYINPRKLYFVDGGDIVKNDNTKFENKGFVCDGSDSHKLKKGYLIKEIDTIDNAGQPISLYSELISRNNIKELSDNLMWLNCMTEVSKNYGKGTFICDRGYDSGLIMGKIIESGNDFIIRANKLNRHIIYKNNEVELRNIAQSVKGYYKYNTTIKGETYNLKVTYKEIKLKHKEMNDKTIYAVIVKGYAMNPNTLDEAYMILFTSRKLCNKSDAIRVVKDYTSRWKIEENFRFKKQQFGLERIMVRRYQRIVNIYTLLSMAMFFNNVININNYGKLVRKTKVQIREHINFWLYRISDGIKLIYKNFSDGLMKILYPKLKAREYNLFTSSNHNKYKLKVAF